MARAILGVAVQRQVGEHHAEAVCELLDGRFELLVGEHRRVQQRERRAGAELAVGHARAIGVVVETQPHTGNRRPHLQWARPVSASAKHPLIPRRAVDPRQELPALELEVLERWRERDVFAESLREREGAKQWVFYEGPPTANGPPGSHHVLSRVFKDIYPRYKTMRGYRVERKGGWDCHGLPVEIAVEQELGIKSKAEIEEYGIGEFNARCRESVFTYLEEWNRLTERIGFWLDLDDAYRTLDESYIESVWWALAEIDRRGLLYEGHKVIPYCPRCETTLSSHEVAQGYRDVVDPSVYLKLPVTSDRGAASEERLLVWTTTPWTLPGTWPSRCRPRRVRARRARDEEHVRARLQARVEAVLGEEAEVLERFSGEELVERYGSYAGPIFALADREPGGYPILADDFVTTEEGTGIVHLAPAFGEDDYRVAAAAGIFRADEPRTRCTTRSGPTAPTTRACATATATPTRAASSRTRS